MLNPTALGAPGTGVAVDAAAFSAFVVQVDGLYINADWRFGSDNPTLDNVGLAAIGRVVRLGGQRSRAARPGS